MKKKEGADYSRDKHILSIKEKTCTLLPIFYANHLSEHDYPQCVLSVYSGVRVSRILHEICLLIDELAITRTNLTLIVRFGFKSDLLIEQYCY